MPNEQVVNKLKIHCEEILKKAAELGLANVKVYKSSFAGYKNKFCCIANIQRGKENEVSYGELGEFMEFLEQTLGCESSASFSDDNNLDKEAIAQAILLSKKNLEKINELLLTPAEEINSEKKALHAHEQRKHPIFSAGKSAAKPHVSELKIQHHTEKSKRSYIQIQMTIESQEGSPLPSDDECIKIAILRLQQESSPKKQKAECAPLPHTRHVSTK